MTVFFFEHHFVVFCPLFTRDYIFLAISSSLAVWLLERGGRENCCIHFVSTPVQKFTHFLFGYILLRERFTPCYAPSSFFQHFNTFLCQKESQCQYIPPCFAEFLLNLSTVFFSSSFFSKLKPVESRLMVLDCIR